MCGLGSALFSEPHQDLHIGRFAKFLSEIDPDNVSSAIIEQESSASASKSDILRIAGYFQQVGFNGTPLTKTFAVLSAFYLCTDVRREVMATTSVLIATPYFSTFEERFQGYLCGTKHLSALIPMEIVLREWQLYSKLISQ